MPFAVVEVNVAQVLYSVDVATLRRCETTGSASTDQDSRLLSVESATEYGEDMSQTHRPHVVVVGGGFAGLSVLKALRNVRARVTLIDRHVYNTFQPLLYQVATATLNPGDITYFLRSVRSPRRPRFHFVNGTVVTMDHEARTLSLDNDATVSYDYLVIATGVTANYFGIPGAAEHAMPLYTRNQAVAVRDAIFTRLENVAIEGQSGDLRVIVVGGGPTGVETAGALAELRNKDMPVTYPELAASRTHITLVEMLPTVLGPFREDIQEFSRRALERRGVELRLEAAVKEVRSDGVVVGDDGQFIPGGVVVWASGVTTHDSIADWGVPQGRGGRVNVDDHLRVKELDRVYAAGDVAVEEGDRALPQLAQPAMQTGAYVGKLLAATLEGRDDISRFEYRDKGTMATIGRNAAVVQIPRLPSITGFPGWVTWMAVHLSYLLGHRNRLATMINLGARYLFWNRSHNAIVGETRPRGSSQDE